MNNNQICYPKTNPNEIGARTIIINRIPYVKIGENSTSVCYVPIVGARKKRRRRTVTPICPPICIIGDGVGPSPPPPTAGCTGMIQTLQSGGVFAPYSNQLEGTGGTSPYTFITPPGTLPPGIILSPDGLLSGIPILPGTFTFTVQATDANGCMGTQEFSITIVAS